jgi:hypothetical protein
MLLDSMRADCWLTLVLIKPADTYSWVLLVVMTSISAATPKPLKVGLSSSLGEMLFGVDITIRNGNNYWIKKHYINMLKAFASGSTISYKLFL